MRNSGAHRAMRVAANAGPRFRVQADDTGPAGQVPATGSTPESSAPGTSWAPGVTQRAFLFQGQVNRDGRR